MNERENFRISCALHTELAEAEKALDLLDKGQDIEILSEAEFLSRI